MVLLHGVMSFFCKKVLENILILFYYDNRKHLLKLKLWLLQRMFENARPLIMTRAMEVSSYVLALLVRMTFMHFLCYFKKLIQFVFHQIAFGLGTMIYVGLELGSFFEIPFDSPCHQILRGVNPLLQMIFTFMQMYFIFMNARVCIISILLHSSQCKKLRHKSKSIFRFPVEYPSL